MKKIAAVLIAGLVILLPLKADEPYSGWKKIHTKHFTLVFEEQSRESAVEIAGFCEGVYTKVTGFFHSYPENILCILHDRIDASNGNFYPLPLELNLYITSPSVPLIGARNSSWLKVLLTHELTHYVNLTFHHGLYYHLSKVFGRSVSAAPSVYMPGWAMEGIAVKLETELTDGGRGRNPFFEMEYRALITENRFYTWKQAAYPSLFPPYDRVYQAGYLINDYLSRTYGDDIFVRIYKKFAAFPPLGFNHAVKAVTGSSVKDIFSAMLNSLQKRYLPDHVSSGVPVSPDTIGDYFLPVITDRGLILYRRTQDRENALVLYDPEGRSEKVLLTVQLHDYASFSADRSGNTIVFASSDARGNSPSGYTLTSDLFLFHPGSKRVTRITRGKHLWQPALSPEGTRLVAVQKQEQYSRLVEVDMQTGQVSPLLSRPFTNVHTPSFSPDGSSIVCAVNTEGKEEIAVLKRRGKAEILTSSLGGEKYFPRFSGSSILFSADTGGSLALYQFSKNGSIQKICEDPVGAYAGCLYKNKILYASYSSRGYCLKEKPIPDSAIYSVREAEKTPLQVLKNPPPREYPTNSPKESRFYDIPQFAFWLPSFLALEPLDPWDISLAPGIVTYSISPMGKTNILTALSLLPKTLQVVGLIDASFSLQCIHAHYTLNEGYHRPEGTAPAEQTTLQNFSIAVPFVQRNYLGTSSSLSGSVGVRTSRHVYALKDFPFLSQAAPLFETGGLYGFAGISADISRFGSFMDIISPQNFSFSSTIYFPLDGAIYHKQGWKGVLSLSVPSFFRHHVLRGSCSWGYSTLPGLSLRPLLRGGFSDTTEEEGSVIAGVDYLFTLGIMDLPIFSGLSLQGLAGGIHVEKSFGFSLQNSSLRTDRYIYTGMELTILGGYTTVAETGGIGLNVKIDTQTPGAFDPSKDLGLYLYLGSNSFTGSFSGSFIGGSVFSRLHR